MLRVWKYAIAIVYGVILVQCIVAMLIAALHDWRAWMVLIALSMAAHFILKLIYPLAPTRDPLERQPHDPAPRHVDAREWRQ